MRSYWTFAVTDEFAFNVSVQVFVLAPPLEHAPLQIASRPFVTLSVTAVPGANCVLLCFRLPAQACRVRYHSLAAAASRSYGQ